MDPKTFHSVWLGIWKVIAGVLMLGGLSLISVVTAAIRAELELSRPESDRR